VVTQAVTKVVSRSGGRRKKASSLMIPFIFYLIDYNVNYKAEKKYNAVYISHMCFVLIYVC
jgi:hypothetical protein